jgi:very-short-patch-repair endonuclease
MNKLCDCGCGREVTKEGNGFLHGHVWKGQKLSLEYKSKISKSHKTLEYKEKIKQTCLKNHGVENPGQSKEIKEKIKQTCLKKHGVENPFQSEMIKEKSKQTCLKNHGVEHSMKSKEIREKSKNTCLNKFGVKNPMQSEKIKEKSKQSCLDKYGETNFAKTPRGRALSRKNYIKMIEDQRLNGEPLSPRIGPTERLSLNELEIISNKKIIRNDHFISNLVSFFPDGHVPELKLFIEFDEKQHFTDDYETYTQKDIDRELILASLGYIIFRISEKQWNSNQNQIIEQFKMLVKELSNGN